MPHFDSHDAPADEASPKPLGIPEILGAVWAGRWIVAVMFALGCAAALYDVASKPNVFRARGRLLFRAGEREEATAENLISGGGSRRPTIEDELQLLSDDSLFEAVVDAIGVDRILEVPDPRRFDDADTPWHKRGLHELQAHLLGLESSDPGPPESASLRRKSAVRILAANTVISLVPRTSVISVATLHQSDTLAPRIVEATMMACLERHRAHYSIDKAVRAGREQIEKTHDEYAEIRKQFYEHLAACGFAADDEDQLPRLNGQLKELERDLDLALIQLDEVEIEEDVLRTRLEDMPATTSVTVPEVRGPNPWYTSRVAERAQLTRARDDLVLEGLSVDEQKRRREQYDAWIAEIDEELAETPISVVVVEELVREDTNPEVAETTGRLEELRLERLLLERRIEGLGRLQAKIATDLAACRSCRETHDELGKAFAAKEMLYRTMSSRLAEMEALQGLAMGSEANLQILHLPSSPAEKHGPDREKPLLMGGVGGLFLGGLLAVLRSRMRSSRETRRREQPVADPGPAGASVSTP